VVLPSLSKIVQQENMILFRVTLLFALRNLMLVLVPTALILVVFSHQIIHLVFQRGAFDEYSTMVTSQVLLYAALGLPFFGASRILVSAFYALHDTKTPVKIATVCLLVNVLLNAILMFPMKIGGIALASSIAGAVNCLLLWKGLEKKLWRNLGPKG
jgi:putative peptidoglycan lipid II flippase